MTAARSQLDQREMTEAQRIVEAVGGAFSAKVVGQQRLRESMLLGLLAGGHLLVESVPGLAKTTAARVIAESIDGGFRRIQCTPDLLPSDIIGTEIYEAATNSFVTRLGPVHTNIVLLDEINRSSAKTQSAMLEAMEERQTTIAGVEYPIPEPFLVIATQNPVDQEGTYPLSEAQTDRFMLKEVVDYPSAQDEVEVISRMDAGLFDRDHRTAPVVGIDDIRRVQGLANPKTICLRARPGSSSTAPARAPPSPSAGRRAPWPCCAGAATSFPTTSRGWHTASCAIA
jgi:MoxR-like ATPase